MIRIEKYNTGHKAVWDGFVENAKNQHFMFYRDFMEYHADRFNDNSLLFYDKNELTALLPANINNGMLNSHGGLTFGGLVLSDKADTIQVLSLFEALIAYAKANNIREINYKALPFIYHRSFAQEDIYALFRNGFSKWRVDVSSTIDLSRNYKYLKGAKSNISKAKRFAPVIAESGNFEHFFNLVKSRLDEKYKANPVHSADEMKLLSSRFPENIKLITAEYNGQMAAGALLFINKNVWHTQYLSSSIEGREIGALDLVIDYAIGLAKSAGAQYFDFGISNEDNGRFLNEGLLFQKEKFGALAMVHEFYRLEF